jgi:hypothetical protein
MGRLSTEQRANALAPPAPAGTTIDVVVMRRASGTTGAAAALDKATTTPGDLAAVTAYLNDPRNNRGGSVPVALLGQNGRVAFRFGTWLVVFEGIVCDPKATILGFSNFNIPHRGSSGEGTIDFGAGEKLPGVLIKYKFANEQNEISINNNRFKLRGKAARLEFDDKAYDATNSVQTILVARDGSTRVAESEAAQRRSPAPDLPAGAMSETVITGYNGGFEVTKSGLPVSWSFYTPRTVPNGDFDIVMDKTDFKEGEQSLKFVVRKCEPTGGRLSPGFFAEYHTNLSPPGPFDTSPGETYKISFWAKNAGSEFVFKARGVSAFNGDQGAIIRSKESFDEWRRFECTYTIPPQLWLRLELNVVQPGTFWIDDLQIVRVNDKAAAGLSDDHKKSAATAAAREWLKLVDAGKFAECWEGCAAFVKSQITKEQVAEAYDGIRKPLGNFSDRTFLSANSFPQLPGTPPGESIVVQFETTFSIGGKQLEQVTLYFDQDNQWRVAGYNVAPAPSEPKNDQDDPATKQKKQAALTAAQQWLKLVDAGKYGEAWDTSAKANKDGIERDGMDLAYLGLFQSLGPIKSRELKSNEYKTQLTRAPVGEYAVIQFSTQFTKGRVTETVVLTREADSVWCVSGYFHAEDKSAPTPSAVKE